MHDLVIAGGTVLDGSGAPGVAADAAVDLVVFDPATTGPRNSYADSRVPPAGIPFVIVNGVPVTWDDAPTDARPGRIIRGDGSGRSLAA